MQGTKKCQELEEIICELRSLLDTSELPGRGNRPLRACGTRFVCHKVRALERILDRFGAYLNHLVTLIEDPSTKSIDKQKLKGYVTKWRNCRILLGCAVFHDILKPAAILCKCLQSDELCIVSTIEAILRTTASLKQLKTTELKVFPAVKKVLDRIKEEPNTSNSSQSSYQYQGAEIVGYNAALEKSIVIILI